MSIAALGLGYLATGVAISIAIAIAKRPPVLDLVLVAAVWPLYAPIALVSRGADPREVQLLSAFARARRSPLAPFVPDDTTLRALGHRLRDASAQLVELEATRTRLAEPSSGVAAELRARTVAHVEEHRTRSRAELDGIAELASQLAAHAELVAWDPAVLDEASELIGELVARLDRLARPEYGTGAGCSP